ncbi:unnamed protein product [Clonostachys byssicola]|uniref:Uncharacterized protein n=1 Tax=Clonostachys byssicola TaxID=160290 RepID=A0A9N9U662_9HYPO|nr:unnamed protein product [Clonostachys byssicola]
MGLLHFPVMRKILGQIQSHTHYVIVCSNGHMYTKFLPGKEGSIFAAVQAARMKASNKPLIVVNMVDSGFCQSDLM